MLLDSSPISLAGPPGRTFALAAWSLCRLLFGGDEVIPHGIKCNTIASHSALGLIARSARRARRGEVNHALGLIGTTMRQRSLGAFRAVGNLRGSSSQRVRAPRARLGLWRRLHAQAQAESPQDRVQRVQSRIAAFG